MFVKCFCLLPIFYWIAYIFLLLGFETSLNVPDNSPLSDIWLANVFSQSVACLLIPFMGCFVKQKFLIFMRSNLLIFFSFMDHTFDVMSKNSLLSSRS